MHSAKRNVVDSQTERTADSMYNFLLGQMAFSKEDTSDALRYLSRASELSELPSATLNLTLAELFMQRGDAAKALMEVERVASVDPSNLRAQFLRAAILESLGETARALEGYRTLLEQDPGMLDGALMASDLHRRSGDTSRAREILRSCAERRPADSVIHYFLARAFEEEQSFLEAEKSMRVAVQLDPHNSGLRVELVRILLKAKRFREARVICREILKQDPNHDLALRLQEQLKRDDSALNDLSRTLRVAEPLREAHDIRFKVSLIHLERKEMQEALLTLLLTLLSDPNNTQARYYLGSLYAGAGRNREAVDELMKITEGDPLYVKSRTFGAYVMRQSGDLDRAEAMIRQAYAASPEDRNIMAYLVTVLRDNDHSDEAQEVLEGALKASPDDDRLLFSYGSLLRHRGERRRAHETMEKVIALNPDHTDALNFVAYGLAEEQRDLQRAITLAERALRVRPNDGYYLDTLGWILYQQGNYAEAEVALGRAASTLNDDPLILEHYGDVLVKRDRLSRAAEIYRQALEHAQDEQGSDPRGRDQESEDIAERIGRKLRDLEAQLLAVATASSSQAR